ncbi:hypothetical protein [Pedobacter sp. L105]|uniref:hypothetical protein n=1 Tax=Pedobacter sp. L105 TaxID=1641871 RepID=UPI00131D13BD|nr:hypothetical protein [Pedobacter sp. L105]
MTTIEEQIWDYIDGNQDAALRSETAVKIAEDEDYKSVYLELIAIHQQIGEISLDEPSMGFNRKIMELVELEMAPVSLKTKVDHRIIYGIAAFFILVITAIMVGIISQINFTLPKTTFRVNVDMKQYFTPTLIRAFIFSDVILGLLYLDGLLRRKKI